MNGIKYERSSIEMASAVMEKKGDKPIPVIEAKEIANSLSDGQGVTKIEFRTAFKILADFKFTKEAQTVFIKIMSEAS
jgi:photosystem II Psb27 protein